MRGLRGQALVPVLFVTLILTAFAVAVASSARREARLSALALHDAQAYQIARGAVEYVSAQLQQATNGGTSPPSLTPPPETDANGWTRLGEGWYRVEIVDTSSRVNLNTADQDALSKLPAFGGLQDQTGGRARVAPILDWRDEDDQPVSADGAESDYYQSLDTPYNAKNAPFDAVDELLLVKGITTAMLYGPPRNEAGEPRPSTSDYNLEDEFGFLGGRAAVSRQAGGSPSFSSVSVESQLPLAELVTTYSRELNFASDGTRRVNVKSANAEALVGTGMSQQLAQRLVQQRQQQGFQLNSIADLLNIQGFTRQVMQQIGDKLTTTDDEARVGMLNINSAPAEALATIPGVDQAIYDAVVNARESGQVFSGLNDLFQLTNLNRQQLQALVDHVCTKSSVYLVRVRVRVKGSPRLYVAEALLDLQAPEEPDSEEQGAQAVTQASAARLLQWREVGRYPGWSNWLPAPSPYSSGGASAATAN